MHCNTINKHSKIFSSRRKENSVLVKHIDQAEAEAFVLVIHFFELTLCPRTEQSNPATNIFQSIYGGSLILFKGPMKHVALLIFPYTF